MLLNSFSILKLDFCNCISSLVLITEGFKGVQIDFRFIYHFSANDGHMIDLRRRFIYSRLKSFHWTTVAHSFLWLPCFTFFFGCIKCRWVTVRWSQLGNGHRSKVVITSGKLRVDFLFFLSGSLREGSPPSCSEQTDLKVIISTSSQSHNHLLS